LSYEGANLKWIFSDDILSKIFNKKNLCFLAKGDVYRDERVLIKAYGSTDEGVSFYMEAGGKKIFHAGDLNNWHWNEEETKEDAAKNEQKFLDELELLAKEVPALDAAMFPVDSRLGKDYMRGAGQFLDRIKTGLFIPMHFWNDFESARAFKTLAEKKGSRFADIRSAGDIFEV
jgi:L-ascorbate metabolism protein UlaG (beta-lactamase superfamily)